MIANYHIVRLIYWEELGLFNTLDRINELRTSRGWSVYHLAKVSGIAQSTIATWYSKNLCPPIDKLEDICNAFDISLAEFFSSGTVYQSDSQTNDILRKWELLSPAQKRIVSELMDIFLNPTD